MSTREYVKLQIDTLPEALVETLAEFIAFQKFQHDIFDSDDDYLSSVPGMNQIIKEGLATPLSECISIKEVRKGVRR